MAIKKWVWKETAEVLGVVGIIAGIVFLGFELRQNTNAIRGTTIQEISNQLVDANFIGVDNPELRVAWQHAAFDSEQVTEAERHILGWYYGGVVRMMENRYRQAQVGTVDRGSLDQLFGFGSLFGTSTFEQWWEPRIERYPEDFANWMEQEVLPRAARLDESIN